MADYSSGRVVVEEASDAYTVRFSERGVIDKIERASNGVMVVFRLPRKPRDVNGPVDDIFVLFLKEKNTNFVRME